MEMQPVLQSLKVRRPPSEMAKTSSRAEDRARSWSQLRLQTVGGNEEAAPFARRAGGLIPSSAGAARRTKVEGRCEKRGGVVGDRVGCDQRAVLQAVRLRGVRTLIIGHPHPNPLAMLPSPPLWLQLRRVGLLLRTRGEELVKGISDASSWGSPRKLGAQGLASLQQEQQGWASTADRGCWFQWAGNKVAGHPAGVLVCWKLF